MYTNAQRQKIQTRSKTPPAKRAGEVSSLVVPNSAMESTMGVSDQGGYAIPDLGQRMQERVGRLHTDMAAEQEATDVGRQFMHSQDVIGDMSSAFGQDLSSVRIHTDTGAARRAAERGVDAFSTGRDIYFAQGAYDRGDPASRGLLAHELSHSLQQGVGGGEGIMAQSAPMGAEQGGFLDWFKKKPTPAPAPPQHTVDTGKFNFGKRSYRKDSELKNFKKLLNAYNTGGGTPEQEIALMQAASSYISEHSTGKRARHKGRTAMMENVLYQLTMKGGTMDRANANIDRISGKTGQQQITAIEAQAKKKDIDPTAQPTQEQQEFITNGARTLEDIRGLYNPGGNYSKAMQMVAADVMSRQDKTEMYNVGTVSNAKAFYENDPTNPNAEHKYYRVNGRVNGTRDDALGTNLHEFTHVASSEAFDNSSIMLTFDPTNESSGETKDEMKRRRQKMLQLQQLASQQQGGPTQSGKKLSDFASERVEYGSGLKANQYISAALGTLSGDIIGVEEANQGLAPRSIPEDERYAYNPKLKDKFEEINQGALRGGMLDNAATRDRMQTEFDRVNHFGDIFLPEFDAYNKSKKASALSRELKNRKTLTDEQRADKQAQYDAIKKEFDGDIPAPNAILDELTAIGPNTMVEYDSVINQMMAQYENQGGDRDSQYYRNLKAEALNSLVRRRAAELRR